VDVVPLVDELVAALTDESQQLDDVVSGLDEAGWQRATPSPGWTIAVQVGHLAWTDRMAAQAAVDPEAFAVRTGIPDVDAAAREAAAGPQAQVLADWRQGREELARALTGLPAGARLPWYGPPMSPVSMATARLMETWAHGVDVTDALGLPPSATDRLRHVAHLGVRTRDFAHRQHGLPVPGEEFRVELTGPDGAAWAWGPADAAQRVTGPALDFCLLVTQRRHRADLALQATGPDADRWLDVAQAFAGPPGSGRAPGGQQ
jgi:uncharacterized protein (TIGR03084 family)